MLEALVHTAELVIYTCSSANQAERFVQTTTSDQCCFFAGKLALPVTPGILKWSSIAAAAQCMLERLVRTAELVISHLQLYLSRALIAHERREFVSLTLSTPPGDRLKKGLSAVLLAWETDMLLA